MQARINIGGILELEVESTTEYWAVQEWLKQVTLTYELETEKFQTIDPRFIELNWQKIATVSNQ